MLDAYTVRKAIPRVVLAVIAINLSIYLCVAALDITTVIGKGLNGLIMGPFIGDNSFTGFGIEGNVENTVAGVLGIGAGVLGGAVGVAMAATGFAASAVAILGFLLPIIVTISLLAIAVLFTLIIRQGLLVFLTVVSPIAFVCYVLPGTEKYFKQWWDLFLRSLMVYPIVAAIFAISNVMASILLSASSADDTGIMAPVRFAQATPDGIGLVQILSAIVALYAPLVLIPFAFKLAGGAISAVMNAASGRAANFAGRAGQAVNKGRQDQNTWMGSRTLAAKQNRMNKGLTGGQMVSGTFAGLGGVASARNLKGFARGYKGTTQSKAATSRFIAAKQFMENNEAFGLFKGDDDVLWASMRATDAAGIRRELINRSPDRFKNDAAAADSTVAQILRAQNQVGAQEFRMAATMAQASTGTGYNYGRDGDDMSAAIIAASGGDSALEGRMLAEMRGATVQSGRADIGGGGFGDHITALSRQKSGEWSVAQARNHVLRNVADSNAGGALAGKPKSVEELAPVFKQQVDDKLYAAPSADLASMTPSKRAEVETEMTNDTIQEFAALAGKYDAAASISPNNARALSKGVLSQKIDVGKLSPQMRDALQGVIEEVQPYMEEVTDPSTGQKVSVQRAGHSSRREITYQQAIEGLRGTPAFREMRREYASETAARMGAQAPDAGSNEKPH